MSGKFTHLMIHCLDTPAGIYFDHKDVEKWHLQERGWSRVGYSAIFLLDGTTQILIPHDTDDVIDSWEISNGAAGWNGRTRHIAYVGGKDNKDTRTTEQYASMQTYLPMSVMLWPDIRIIGHNQVNKHKYCPSFDVPEYCRFIGIPDKNIDFNRYWK